MCNLIAYAAADFGAAMPSHPTIGRDQRGGAAKGGASVYAAARVARIVLRREPSVSEALAWTSIAAKQPSAARGRAELALALLSGRELAAIDMRDRVARAYDAVLDRYDSCQPDDLDHWERQLREHDVTLAELMRNEFVHIAESGYRYNPCAAPVDAGRPFFAVRDGAGQPLVFSVGANSRLYLFRRTVFGTWSQTDLSAVLPHGRVQDIDVRQAADGGIAVALAMAPRDGDVASTVLAATGLSGALDETGWLAAFRQLAPRTALPFGAVVGRIAFAPLQAGAVPLVALSAAVHGRGDSWVFNGAAPATAPMLALRMPAAHGKVIGYAVGSFRLPGMWSLYDQPCGGAGNTAERVLAFDSFPDQFGAALHVRYSDLPARATSVHLAPSAVPNVPDVYVAGEGIVVYRCGHDVPQPVAYVSGARIVWSGRDEAAEHIAYADAGGGLWRVTRAVGCGWGQPQAVATTLVAATLACDGAGGLHAVGMTPGGALEWHRIDAQGKARAVEEITQAAVWNHVRDERARMAPPPRTALSA